ncbi:cation transporter [Ancylomarina sp. DW003]|nr:heavy-metal-associated domain-containing protein [Ancylomarina sp. DW003]MDE5421009.1 cation transporter [Ancylomarina sp. DW003]
MYRKMLSLICFSFLGLTLSVAQNATESFKVSGKCGMCESRIEKAASSVDGVTSADWNKDSKIIEVSFNGANTNVHKIHKAIANAGHDTEMHKAKDEVYSALHGCCKYNRVDLSQKDKNKGHKHTKGSDKNGKTHDSHSGCGHSGDQKSSSGC